MVTNTSSRSGSKGVLSLADEIENSLVPEKLKLLPYLVFHAAIVRVGAVKGTGDTSACKVAGDEAGE